MQLPWCIDGRTSGNHSPCMFEAADKNLCKSLTKTNFFFFFQMRDLKKECMKLQISAASSQLPTRWFALFPTLIKHSMSRLNTFRTTHRHKNILVSSALTSIIILLSSGHMTGNWISLEHNCWHARLCWER